MVDISQSRLAVKRLDLREPSVFFPFWSEFEKLDYLIGLGRFGRARGLAIDMRSSYGFPAIAQLKHATLDQFYSMPIPSEVAIFVSRDMFLDAIATAGNNSRFKKLARALSFDRHFTECQQALVETFKQGFESIPSDFNLGVPSTRNVAHRRMTLLKALKLIGQTYRLPEGFR